MLKVTSNLVKSPGLQHRASQFYRNGFTFFSLSLSLIPGFTTPDIIFQGMNKISTESYVKDRYWWGKILCYWKQQIPWLAQMLRILYLVSKYSLYKNTWMILCDDKILYHSPFYIKNYFNSPLGQIYLHRIYG